MIKKNDKKEKRNVVFRADRFLSFFDEKELISLLEEMSAQRKHKMMIPPNYNISEVKIINNSVIIKLSLKKK